MLDDAAAAESGDLNCEAARGVRYFLLASVGGSMMAGAFDVVLVLSGGSG